MFLFKICCPCCLHLHYIFRLWKRMLEVQTFSFKKTITSEKKLQWTSIATFKLAIFKFFTNLVVAFKPATNLDSYWCLQACYKSWFLLVPSSLLQISIVSLLPSSLLQILYYKSWCYHWYLQACCKSNCYKTWWCKFQCCLQACCNQSTMQKLQGMILPSLLRSSLCIKFVIMPLKHCEMHFCILMYAVLSFWCRWILVFCYKILVLHSVFGFYYKYFGVFLLLCACVFFSYIQISLHPIYFGVALFWCSLQILWCCTMLCAFELFSIAYKFHRLHVL